MSRIVAWTGHRPDLFRDPAAARQALCDVARELMAAGTERFLVGGQRGVDTWAAETAMAHAVPFELILPFPPDEFARDWLEADRSLLHQTLAHAADVRVAGGYSARNRQLAVRGQLLVAVWTRTAGGGTAETIDIARQAGTPVREVLLDPSPAAANASGRGI
jgi:YspA SLOG family